MLMEAGEILTTEGQPGAEDVGNARPEGY